MDKLELLYEGKGKKIYSTNNDEFIIAEFKDDLTAFNAEKKGLEFGKGSLNCQISAIIFELLNKNNITNHFIKLLDSNNMLCKKLTTIPLEVVVRNISTGSLSKRLGIENGKSLPFSIVEFYYKDDLLNDPIINDDHCIIMNILHNEEEIGFIKKIAISINEILINFFNQKGIKLVDFKIEFGRDKSNNIILIDEISPDSCRLWDKNTNKKMDKDIFRENLGNVSSAYKEILNRIKVK